jgi:hypothetical protein
MAGSATRKAPARGSMAARENFLPPLRVTYYRRMKRQRVYPVHVCWKEAERGVPGKEVTLRLIVAGAQVAPIEQNLKPTDPEDAVTFYVTPVAKGRLGNPHLEVIYQGRKVQELPLPSRVVSQGWSWIFLGLAFLLPWLLLHVCKYSPLQEGTHTPGETLEKLVADNVPGVPTLVRDNLPDAETWLKNLRGQIGETYDSLCDVCQREPIAFYVGVGFMALALLGSWWNSTGKKRLQGKPIPIPATAASRAAGGDED